MKKFAAVLAAVLAAISVFGQRMYLNSATTNANPSIATASWATNWLGNTNVFNVRLFGAHADGVTDDTFALTNALLAAQNARGGSVYIPAGIYSIQKQIFMPNDGTLYLNQVQAGYVYKQSPIRIYGDNPDFNFNVQIAPTNGTVLLMNAVVAQPQINGAKINCLNAGNLEIDHLTLKDTTDGSSAFIYDNNTVLYVHDVLFHGLQPNTPAQDGIILGGTNASSTLAGNGVTNGFQGYGSKFEHNYFNAIRHLVLYQTWANSVPFVGNTAFVTCGGDYSIILNGDPVGYNGGNTISDNLIESPNYTGGVLVTNSWFNTFSGDYFWDNTFPSGTAYRFEASATHNVVVGGMQNGTTAKWLNNMGTYNAIVEGDLAVLGSSLGVGMVPDSKLSVFDQGGANNVCFDFYYSSSYWLQLFQGVSGGDVSWSFNQLNAGSLYTNVMVFEKGNVWFNCNVTNVGGVWAGNGSGLTNLQGSATNTLIVGSLGITNNTTFSYIVSITAGTAMAMKDPNNVQFMTPILGSAYPLKPGWGLSGTAITATCTRFP